MQRSIKLKLIKLSLVSDEVAFKCSPYYDCQLIERGMATYILNDIEQHHELKKQHTKTLLQILSTRSYIYGMC